MSAASFDAPISGSALLTCRGSSVSCRASPAARVCSAGSFRLWYADHCLGGKQSRLLLGERRQGKAGRRLAEAAGAEALPRPQQDQGADDGRADEVEGGNDRHASGRDQSGDHERGKATENRQRQIVADRDAADPHMGWKQLAERGGERAIIGGIEQDRDDLHEHR